MILRRAHWDQKIFNLLVLLFSHNLRHFSFKVKQHFFCIELHLILISSWIAVFKQWEIELLLLISRKCEYFKHFRVPVRTRLFKFSFYSHLIKLALLLILLCKNKLLHLSGVWTFDLDTWVKEIKLKDLIINELLVCPCK
jgi:hypothetical protein